MKKILYRTCLIAFIANTSGFNAQSIWAKQIGGTLNDKGNVIKVDVNGNIYTMGTFSGTCDLDPSANTFMVTSAGNTDIFLTKLNATGNFVWGKRIGGTGVDNVSDMNLDASGNICFTGDFNSNCDFDPGPLTSTITPFGATDIYICKLDINGDFVWVKQMGGGWFDRGVSINIDANSDIIVSGDFSTSSSGLTADFDPGPGTFTFTTGSGGGNTDIFITKLTSNGNFVWAKQIGGTNGDFANSVKTDNLNNIFIGGYFSGTTDFDPNTGISNLTSTGLEDIYILKLDASGNFSWARNMGSITVDYCKAITIDAIGNVYSTGSFRGTADFDPSPSTYTLNSVSGDDVFICKLDNSGNFVWARGFGSMSADAGNSIATDALGNVFTIGGFRLSLDINPGFDTYTLSAFGNADIYLQKLDANGNFLWAGQMGGAADDIGTGIYIDISGIVYTTGYFNTNGDFDPTSSNVNLTSIGQSDVFVQRFCQPPNQPGFIAGNNTYCGNGIYSYSVASIPGASSYSWNIPSGWLGASTSNSISVITTGSGLISVAAVNSCATGLAQTYSITINPLPTVTATTSNSLICAGQSVTLSAGGANLYTWNPSGSGSSIIINPTITTTYSVTGLDLNGCQNTAIITQFVSSCTAISQIQNQTNIFIYPNPSSGQLKLESSESGLILKIFNSLGQLLITKELTEKSTNLDIKEFTAGIYYLEVMNENGKSIQKLIKE